MKLRSSVHKVLLFSLLAISLHSCFLQSRPRRAQRQLKKENYAKAEKLLRKELEKDSINPAAYWLLSKLYLDTAYQQRIDTAHLYILKALQQAPLERAKDKKRWRKLGLDSTALALQHTRVDSAAFNRATSQHTVDAYQYFLNNYPLAQQVAEATALRNELAFAAAEEIGTWQAYQQFFQTYPLARQVTEARERYEELLFKERTRTGTLQAYRRFLAEHPKTPYRDRLLRNIYRLSTADHKPQSYYAYIQNHPESPYNQQALVQLYYLHEKPATLWQQYPNLPRPDSIKVFEKLAGQQILAVMQQGKWGFVAEDGTTVLPADFADIHPDYVCESLERDYAEVLKDGKPQVVAWNGQVLLEGDYEAIEPLGKTLIRVQADGQQGLMTKRGQWLLQPEHNHIRAIGSDLLLVQQAKQRGLLAPNGLWLLNPQPDSLARLHDFILRIRGNRLSVHSRPELIRAAQENEKITPAFTYASARLIADSLLLAINPDSSWQILNSRLITLASGQKHLPSAVPGGLIVRDANEYRILNLKGEETASGKYQQVMHRQDGLAVKQNGRWSLLQLPNMQPAAQNFDSLQLLHPQLLWYRNGGRDSLLFLPSRKKMDLLSNESVRLLRPQYFPDSLIRRDQYDKVVIDAGKILRIYSLQGNLLHQGRFEEVQAPDPALLIFRTDKGTATLADTSGLLLLKSYYDGIGNYQKGYMALLKGNRFGSFNPYQKVLINPQFDAAPRPYNQQLLAATKNKKWGLIDVQGKNVLPHRYQSIRLFTDSIALVQEEGQWQLMHIYQGQPLLRDILEVNWLREPHHPKGGIAIIEMRAGYGVASTKGGILAAPLFDDVQNLGTLEAPLFYMERQNKQTNQYDITYMNEQGKVIFQNTYSQAEWELLICD